MVGVLWGEGKPGGLRRAGEGQSLGAPLGAVGGGGGGVGSGGGGGGGVGGIMAAWPLMTSD